MVLCHFFFLPGVGGPQVDSHHSAHTLLLVVVIGNHGAGHQHYNPQQLHLCLFKLRSVKEIWGEEIQCKKTWLCVDDVGSLPPKFR